MRERRPRLEPWVSWCRMPARTCTGCRKLDAKERMIRVVRSYEGPKVDPRQCLPGRGAYVHRDERCVKLALSKGGLARTLKCSVPSSLLEEVEAVRNR